MVDCQSEPAAWLYPYLSMVLLMVFGSILDSAQATGPAEVEVQVTIKIVGTAEEAQRIADLLDASVIPAL